MIQLMRGIRADGRVFHDEILKEYDNFSDKSYCLMKKNPYTLSTYLYYVNEEIMGNWFDVKLPDDMIIGCSHREYIPQPILPACIKCKIKLNINESNRDDGLCDKCTSNPFGREYMWCCECSRMLKGHEIFKNTHFCDKCQALCNIKCPKCGFSEKEKEI